MQLKCIKRIFLIFQNIQYEDVWYRSEQKSYQISVVDLLLPDELDEKLRDFLINMLKVGGTINRHAGGRRNY